jgi:ribosome-interacting GTPase 1
MILMVLEATKAEEHKVKISRELEKVGIRLNKNPPLIAITPTKLGGVKLNSTKALTHLNEKVVKNILSEYKIHNADVLVHDDSTVDDFIDIVEGTSFLIQETESMSSASTATTRSTLSPWRKLI